MKKIAIMGTAANPIHMGHLAIAKAVSEIVDEVWISPCWNHMFNKDLASSNDRLTMCQLAVNELTLSKIKVCAYEVANQSTCGTYEILNELKSLYNDSEFYFIIGQDNADNIEKWRNYKKLISEYKFIVVPRAGYSPKTNWYQSSEHIYLKDFTPLSISSTFIREEVRSKGTINKKMVPSSVATYIEKLGLYAK